MQKPKVFSAHLAKIGLIFIIVIVTISLASDWGYQQRVSQTKAFPVACLEGWAHRGYINATQGIKENTIASYQQAINLGATGIEMDVLYDVDMDDFIVSHDTPYHLQDDGTVLLLKDVLAALPAINIWLDAKNLSSLWPWQAAKATARLRHILSTAKQGKQVLVESRSPWYLRDLSQHGIYTTLMISPEPNRNIVVMWGSIIISKLYFSMGEFSGVSMGIPSYTGQAKISFNGSPSYLSTMNSKHDLQQYIQQSQVKVFLTDNPELYGYHCSP